MYAYSRLESGLLMTTYRMVPEDQIRVPRCDLSDLIGLSLYGEVVRVIHDHVQLSLPMDEGPMTQGAACPYPIAPAYAAEGHSGLYIMPEIGDTVELYFPGSRESGAYIRNAVPEGKRSVSGGSDHKVWGHPAGGSIGMSPEEVTLQAGSGMTITLNDQGVILESPGNLSIQGSNITFKAGQIEATAPEAIWLLGGGGSFILDGEANVRGSVIQQEGSNKAPVHVADLPPEPEPPLMPIEEYEAAQAAAAAEAAAATQASTTNPKAGSLFGAALAVAGMIPIVGALVGAAVAAQAVGMAAAAAGVIGGIPKTGSFRPSALGLLNQFTNGFVEKLQQENDAKRNLLGKMLTAAKELTTSTSLTDFMKKLHQQSNEVSAAYYETPPYIREKWATQYEYQQADQELRDSLDYFKKMMKNPDEYNVLFVGAHFANITFDIGRPFITEEELGSYDYWKSQGLSLDEMKYLAWRLKAPMSDQAFAELFDGYREYDAMLKGMDTEFNYRTKGSSGGGFVIPTKSIPQSGETTPPKGKTFFQKFFEDSQKMGIVSGGGSNWGNKNKSKTGETFSGSGKVSDNETGSGSTTKPAKDSSKSGNGNTSTAPSSKTSGSDTTKPSTNSTASKNKPDENESGSPPKPAKNSSETEKNNTSRTPSSKTSESDTTKPSTNHTASKNKPNENESESPPKPAKNASETEKNNTSRTPSSKTSESDATATPKNSTTSKNKNNQDEAPNEVNSWKPKASKKKKDEGKPKGDSKPPESSKTDKPKENSNVHKPKEDTKDYDDREDDNWEAQKPMFGEDWDAYFRSKYGDKNVKWETKESGKGIDAFGRRVLRELDISTFEIKNKHLASSASKRAAKFNVDTVEEATLIVKDALENGKLVDVLDNGIGDKGQQSFSAIIETGKVIGTKGQTKLKIVYDEDKTIWTVYPIN